MDNECSNKASAFQGPPTLQPFRLAEHDLIKAEHQSGPRVGRFTPIAQSFVSALRAAQALDGLTRRAQSTRIYQERMLHEQLKPTALSGLHSVGASSIAVDRKRVSPCQHMSAD